MHHSLQLWITRHGQTEENVQRILAGQLGGTLTQLGKEQASQLGTRLANETFDKVYVSDLQRTRDTYDLIAQHLLHKPTVEYSKLIREKSNGIYEHQSIDILSQLAKQHNVPIRSFRPEQGESFDDVSLRAEQFLDLLLQQKDTKVFFVSHGGFLMEFFNVLSKNKNINTAPITYEKAKNCALTVLNLKKAQNGKLDVEYVLNNDCSHIK